MIKLVHLDKSRKTESFAEINLEEIKDICFAKGHGYFFISNFCIGNIDLFGKITYPLVGKPGISQVSKGFRANLTLDNPSSLCYSENGKRLLVVCRNGSRVVSLDILNDYYCLPAFSNTVDKSIDPFFNINTKNGGTSIVSDGGNIGWTASSTHRAFIVSNSVLRIIGNGKAGYSIANKEEYASMNSPSGIILKGNDVMIADKQNHCVRVFSDKTHSVLMGHPLNSDVLPEKMVLVKDSLYIMDKNEIKLMFSSKTKPVSIHKADIISFTLGINDNLAILVKE